MYYIDPHIHMISRVTDDYHRMAQCGCVAVSEPAFWAGFDRGCAAAFHDYFRQLTEYEPKRAAQFHIRHYCWLCINAKEAENVSLSREVITLIPEFLGKLPSGQEFAAEHIHIWRLQDGQVIEHWSVRDDLGQALQLGLLPADPATEAGDR